MIQTMIQRWYKDDTKLMSFVYLARFFLLSMFFGGEMPSTHFLYHSLMFWITIDCVCDTRYKLICHFYNVESFCFLHCAAFQHYTVLFLSPECITFATTKTLRMKNITCILYLPPYLHDYIVNKYGVPAKFPKHSAENDLLSYLSERRREIPLPHRGIATSIILPDHRFKKPEYYHHFSRRSHARLVRCLVRSLRIDLWDWMQVRNLSGHPIGASLDKWCSHRGIKVVNREAVRRLYYRLRAAR